MTKQIKTVMISLVVTLILLFGGYQGYKYIQIDKPIDEVFRSQQNISIKNVDSSPGDIQIEVAAKPNYAFIEQIPRTTKQLNELFGEGKWNLTFQNTSTTKLDHAWRQMVFGIQEAVQTKHYTLIPTTVKQIADAYHLSYDMFLDDYYVYLVLHDGNKTVYQIIPTKEAK